jgi:hypothetical protein
MGLSGSFWTLVVAYLLLQPTSNTAHGPAQGLIPDLVLSEKRGLASGLKTLFEMAGLVVTSLAAGQLMGEGNVVLPFAIMTAVLADSGAVTLVETPEPPEAGEAPTESDDLRSLQRVDLRAYPDYGWLIASRFLILTGVYAVQSFELYYIRDWLGPPDAAAVTGNLMTAVGVALVLLVFPACLLSDRKGRRRLNVLAGAPAASRLGGPLIDVVNGLRPGAYWGYPLLFVLASGSTLLRTGGGGRRDVQPP